MPGGSAFRLNDFRATSARSMALSVPATVNLPFSKTMSCSAASSVCAASFFPLAMTLSAAISSAVPPQAIEREPKVPVPIAIWSVSPYWKRTRSGGMPSLSAMICR